MEGAVQVDPFIETIACSRAQIGHRDIGIERGDERAADAQITPQLPLAGRLQARMRGASRREDRRRQSEKRHEE
jgi:hypothetical protein